MANALSDFMKLTNFCVDTRCGPLENV